ncbi:MAG: hypothetical protein FJ096_15410 [Deltaproteobacteria bacterium]|nr:hypothetical protein [Deltaproteobacteria bacterium]
MLRPPVLATLVAGSLVLASPAAASPQGVLGFGHRAMALGTTGTASAEGADAVYENPALLSAARHTTLQLGFEGAALGLRVDGPGMPGAVGATPLRATTIGAVLPLPFAGILRDRAALGLGFVTPTDVVVRARLLYPERVQFPLADRLQSVAVQAAMGLDLGHGVRLGAGVTALAALEGDVLVRTDVSGKIGTQVSDTLVASYAPVFGASWESASGRHRVGVAFRGELVGRFDVVIRAEDLGSIVIPPLHVSGLAQYEPWQLAVEAARVEGPVRVAFGLKYAHWSAYPGPAEATVRCEDAPELEGACDAKVPQPVGYRGTVSPRFGVEGVLDLGPAAELKGRAGYAFEPTPAPEQRGARNLFDMSRSVASVGIGVAFARLPFSLDAFAQLQMLHARTHEKRVEDGAPSSFTVTTAGTLSAGGLAVTVKLR